MIKENKNKLLIFPLIFVILLSPLILDDAFAHHEPLGHDYYAHVVKQNDESLVSSTVMQDDDELFVYLDWDYWSGYYSFEFKPFWTQDGGDICFQFVPPTGGSVRINDNLWQPDQSQLSLDGTLEFCPQINSEENSMPIHGYVYSNNGAWNDDGKFKVQWSQDSSSALPTTVLSGSSLIVWYGTGKVAHGIDSVASSTVLKSHDDLYMDVEANTSYLVDLKTFYDAPNDVDYAFTIPTGATLRMVDDEYDPNEVFATVDGTVERSTAGLSGTIRAIQQWGVLNTAGNAGTLTYQFAQNVADADDADIMAGSSLHVFKDTTWSKVKQSDEFVFGSTAMQDDDDFSFQLKANTDYAFDVRLLIDSPSNADFDYRFVVPTGAEVRLNAIEFDAGDPNPTLDGTLEQSYSTASNVNGLGGATFGVVRMGNTAGELKMQWAQGSIDGVTPAILKAGSAMIVYEETPRTSTIPINPAEEIVIKLNDELRLWEDNSDTPEEDSELKIWLEANKIYTFESRIWGESINNPSSFGACVIFDYDVPVGAHYQGHIGDNSDWSSHFHKNAWGNAPPTLDAFLPTFCSGFDEGDLSTLEHNGKIVMGDTAGYFTFRWTPENNPSPPTGFEVKRGSSIRVMSEDTGAIRTTQQSLIKHEGDPLPDDHMFVNVDPNEVYSFESRYFLEVEHSFSDPMYFWTTPTGTEIYGHLGCTTSDWSFHFLKPLYTNDPNDFCHPEFSSTDNFISDPMILQHTGAIVSGNKGGNVEWAWSDQSYVTDPMTYFNGTSMRVYQDDGNKVAVKQTDTSSTWADRGDGEPVLYADTDLTVPLEPNKLYTYEARIMVEDTDGSNDAFTYSWRIPDGALLYQSSALQTSSDWSSHHGKEAGELNTGTEWYFPDNNLSGLSANDNGIIELHGIVDMAGAGNGGDLEFIWNQGFNGGGTTELLAGSSVRVYEADAVTIDSDGDGIPDNIDNCVNTPNPNQADFNNDGLGDVCSDLDGDALFDSWEIVGIDSDENGIIDLDLASLGADPERADVFVEVDYMQFHTPLNAAMNRIVNSFDDSPYPNPDGSTGITLHVLVDDQIPLEQDWVFSGGSWPNFENAKSQFNMTSVERNDPNVTNIWNAWKKVYHYSIFINSQNGTSSTGRGEIHGDDFVVSLGVYQIDLNMQAGTFMHELGHNLGLYHGGDIPPDHNGNNIINEQFDRDADNCKPNYLSVMSYTRQTPYPLKLLGLFSEFFPAVLFDNTEDYSHSVLTTLTENSLDEQVGMNQSIPIGLHTVIGDGSEVVRTGEPIDWNDDGDFTDIGVTRNINFIDFEPFPPISGCDIPLNDQTLSGFDDWNNLRFNFTDSPNFGPGLHLVETDDELLPASIEPYRLALNNPEAAADSLISKGTSKKNDGINPVLRVGSGGDYRTLVQFDQNHIDVASLRENLTSAKVRLFLTDTGGNWGNGGNVTIHRILETWVEGNGWNTGNNIKGNGTGVTWNCSIDTDISNNKNDCAIMWDGGNFDSNPTSIVLITNNLQNQWIDFDVTSDVKNFINGTSNYGWLIKVEDENQSARIELDSRESNNIPELNLTFENQLP